MGKDKQSSNIFLVFWHTLHNWEPSVVTWNYENIRSLRVVIWSQKFPLSYLVQPLERLKYIKDLVQMHLNFGGIGPKMWSPRF